jgi:ribosomal protein S3
MQSNVAPAQTMANASANLSKRRKFIADGVFYAELNEFFQRELAEEGYSGVEVRVTPTVTDIIIRATHTQEVLGEQGRRIREVCILMWRDIGRIVNLTICTAYQLDHPPLQVPRGLRLPLRR